MMRLLDDVAAMGAIIDAARVAVISAGCRIVTARFPFAAAPQPARLRDAAGAAFGGGRRLPFPLRNRNVTVE